MNLGNILMFRVRQHRISSLCDLILSLHLTQFAPVRYRALSYWTLISHFASSLR
jgi:hypothetical protein